MFSSAGNTEAIAKQASVLQLIRAHRVRGHLYAHLNPLGWEPELSMGPGRYHVTAWRVEKRNRAGFPGAWGITGLAEQRFGRLLPFIRYGYAQDQVTPVEHLLSVGLTVLEVFGHDQDVIGIGVSWGEPTRSDQRDQWAGELFYRMQVLPNLQVTPSIQGILDPATNRKHEGIAIFGIRARFTF